MTKVTDYMSLIPLEYLKTGILPKIFSAPKKRKRNWPGINKCEAETVTVKLKGIVLFSTSEMKMSEARYHSWRTRGMS